MGDMPRRKKIQLAENALLAHVAQASVRSQDVGRLNEDSHRRLDQFCLHAAW
jgi:hypothetical protein